ncbi:hemolysin III [Spirochaetia bacterium]|nr:hemolysin III [Spirochaetia bacterium]
MLNKKYINAPVRVQTIGEETANSILHGFGAALSILGLVLLTMRTQGFFGGTTAGAVIAAACVIYTATLFIMFMASTLYHAIRIDAGKKILRIIDHSAIYLLIAGTYTPICLMVLPKKNGLPIFFIEWAFAVAGVLMQAFKWRFLKKAEVIIYVVMGLAVAAAAPSLWRTMQPVSILFLLVGGAAYLLGIIWYKRPQHKFCHVIWHVFVLAGACLQWFSIYLAS